MATTEARPHGRVITGRIGDPQEGVRQPEPIVLPERRLALLAHRGSAGRVGGRPRDGDWLRFMARLARAQQAAVTAMPPVAPSAVADAVAACMPPLAAGAHRRDPAWRSGLAALLDRPGEDALPAQAVEVIAWLRRADAAALEELADGYLRRSAAGAGRLARHCMLLRRCKPISPAWPLRCRWTSFACCRSAGDARSAVLRRWLA